jgi:hypothetical protein
MMLPPELVGVFVSCSDNPSRSSTDLPCQHTTPRKLYHVYAARRGWLKADIFGPIALALNSVIQERILQNRKARRNLIGSIH